MAKVVKENSDSDQGQKWSYQTNGKRKGPYSSDKILDIVEDNIIDLETFVWT